MHELRVLSVNFGLASPPSLSQSCLDFISDNLEAICEDEKLDLSAKYLPFTVDDLDMTEPGDELIDWTVVDPAQRTEDEELAVMMTDDLEEREVIIDALRKRHERFCRTMSEKKYGTMSLLGMKFAGSQDHFFHSDISESLLETLDDKGRINNRTLSLFEASHMRLTSVKLRKAQELTTGGLMFLKGHKITDLTVNGLTKATVTDLIGCLDDWSKENLKHLNVANSTFVDLNKIAVVVTLSQLKNLRTLNVSGTEFIKSSLEMVVDDLPNLESIDISLTKVTDISCLRKIKFRLKSLSIHGLKPPLALSNDQLIDVLMDLTELRHLDVSESEVEQNNHPLNLMNEKIRVAKLIQNAHCLPNLVSLDLSGKPDLNIDELTAFVLAHKPRLKFLGLLLTETCKNDIFTDPNHEHFDPDLRVTGAEGEGQIVSALTLYLNRPYYTQKSLFHLFKLTQQCQIPRGDIIQLVVKAAHQYQTVFNIQMAATACLFNLSKGELGQNLHPRILADIVSVNLDAMEEFPQHQQLQKNVLLTICSDRILQEVSFDRYRCARLVMDCLCAYSDQSMNRMSVAVCSILAAKISTKETSELGSEPKYMKKLLQMVQKRMEDMQIDITLKFTLSALWNLTDESPKTCGVFLKEGGMYLFLKVLDAFPGELSIETKVLGLLNNIAEVKELRRNLMVDPFINLLSKLMHSKHIDVSYFAAGIVAHLASEGDWTVQMISEQEMTNDLQRVVCEWRTPKEEMVAYRSFRPFFPLMGVSQPKAVQLWAVWAVHHVCSKNPNRYCPMLAEQGGNEVILQLVDSYMGLEKIESYEVIRLTLNILRTLSQTGVIDEEEAGKRLKSFDIDLRSPRTRAKNPHPVKETDLANSAAK